MWASPANSVAQPRDGLGHNQKLELVKFGNLPPVVLSTISEPLVEEDVRLTLSSANLKGACANGVVQVSIFPNIVPVAGAVNCKGVGL